MRRAAHRVLLCLIVLLSTFSASARDFSGAETFAFTKQAVLLGPRPGGSAAIVKLRAMINQQLARRGCDLIPDRFTAQTPDGPVTMENIIDGEEAFHEWTDSDSLYGSRHLAAKWTADGTNRRLKALINVDMIGDKNLRVMWDTNSAASVRKLVWDVADSLGYLASFPRNGSAITDDHMPFLSAGVRAIDLIDFDSQNTFWHTPKDTLDKLDPHGLEVIGSVVMKSIAELEQTR